MNKYLVEGDLSEEDVIAGLRARAGVDDVEPRFFHGSAVGHSV
ncbi:MAG: hypothetical protein ACK5JI_10400 [Azonexus sp.]